MWSHYFVEDSSATRPLHEICSTQSEFHQVQTPDRSHFSDTSQQSNTGRYEKMEPAPTHRCTSLPSSVCTDPVLDLDGPSPKRRHLDTTKEKLKKITKKKLLRRLAQPKHKLWSCGATPPSPSDEKKISASLQSQDAKDRLKNTQPVLPNEIHWPQNQPQDQFLFQATPLEIIPPPSTLRT